MSSKFDDLDRYPVAEPGGLTGEVPVIDVAHIMENVSSRAALSSIEKIATACREWGFFQVVNHGISQDLIDKTWSQTCRFFNAEQSTRDAVRRTSDHPWGYYNNELTKNQRDKKEVFDFTTEGVDPIYAAKNQWPDFAPGFRQTMSAYRDDVTALSLSLLDAFCVGLNLPADFMRQSFGSDHTGFIRLNYYPVKDPMTLSGAEDVPEASLGVHHHSDAGALTVLMQDEVGGLQVFNNGYWHDVDPLPGAFVINTGDMMQVWSNDIYQAAVHRVLAMDQTDRYSIPFFFNPAANTRVSPLPGVVSQDRPARYRAIQWSDFRGKRTDGDYSDYGPEVQISQFRI